jgi:hypothetical protein
MRAKESYLPGSTSRAAAPLKEKETMKSLRSISLIATLILAFACFALAGNGNEHGKGDDKGGNPTSNVSNQNVNSSNSSSSVSGSGNSSITDNSKTTNTNTAFGGQGGTGIGIGGDSYAKGGDVKDSGNSASFSNAQGGSVKDSGNSSNLNLNSAKGGDVKDSGNSYSSNKNSNKQGQAQGQDQGQSQESVSGASASNEGNNTSITTNVAAPKIPVNSAYAPNAFPTANCAMAYSGAGQGMLAGAAGAFTRIDKTCQQIETARSFALYDARTAYCKVMISTKWAKKAHVTLEDCMTKEAVPVPVPAASITTVPEKPVAAIVNPYPSR